MLTQLIIKNYALIENLDIQFSNGLTVFTGETGAGKSIIIDALQIALGERAGSDIIRKGEKRAIINAIFDIKNNNEIKSFLSDHSIDSENEELILRKEIDISGKSKAYCNDQMVSSGLLEKLGQMLVDVHGQYEHQTLLKPSNQLELLDRYSELEELKEKAKKQFKIYNELIEEIEKLKLKMTDREQKISLLEHQLNEIKSANLKPDEDREISEILPGVKNTEKINELGKKIISLINGENSLLDNILEILKMVKEIERLAEKKFPWSENIENQISLFKDVSHEIEDFISKNTLDKSELERLIDRNDLIIKLKKKYGKDINEIINYSKEIEEQIKEYKKIDENISSKEEEFLKVKEQLNNYFKELSEKRKEFAEKLSKDVTSEIRELGMPKALFRVQITENKQELTQYGWDKIEFLFQANPGEDLKPLKEIASGGEMSRCMLALKTVLGKHDKTPVMIFDEIDSGVSGPMGQVIGRKLSKLSKFHQIFCITHLAQIASFARTHLKVEKSVKDGRTFTTVKILNPDEHIQEIARMLSGEKITETSLKHARELIKETT